MKSKDKAQIPQESDDSAFSRVVDYFLGHTKSKDDDSKNPEQRIKKQPHKKSSAAFPSRRRAFNKS